VDWLEGTLHELQINADHRAGKLFKAGSPVRLTPAGERILAMSRLKSFVDAHEEEFVKHCKKVRPRDHYEIQFRAFRLLDSTKFSEPYERELREFAFSNGLSLELLRRVAAIYLCNIVTRNA
jgi:hypothetical protein